MKTAVAAVGVAADAGVADAASQASLDTYRVAALTPMATRLK
jgi:hypothetical protein